MDKDAIVVYWAPATFADTEESWNLLYPEPELVRSKLQKLRTDNRQGFHVCPSVKTHLENLYVMKSAIEDDIDLPIDFLKQTYLNEDTGPIPSKNRQIISLRKERESSLQGYSNLVYNVSWIFFSEEPLIARFTAPYLPPVSPSPGAIMTSGEFDIGSWFRPYNLDYHIPLDNNFFKVNEEQELAYVKFQTDKKVILKRFSFTKTLHNYAAEMSNSPNRYKRHVPLLQRYQMAKNSKMQKLILKTIKENVIE